MWLGGEFAPSGLMMNADADIKTFDNKSGECALISTLTLCLTTRMKQTLNACARNKAAVEMITQNTKLVPYVPEVIEAYAKLNNQNVRHTILFGGAYTLKMFLSLMKFVKIDVSVEGDWMNAGELQSVSFISGKNGTINFYKNGLLYRQAVHVVSAVGTRNIEFALSQKYDDYILTGVVGTINSSRQIPDVPITMQNLHPDLQQDVELIELLQEVMENDAQIRKDVGLWLGNLRTGHAVTFVPNNPFDDYWFLYSNNRKLSERASTKLITSLCPRVLWFYQLQKLFTLNIVFYSLKYSQKSR